MDTIEITWPQVERMVANLVAKIKLLPLWSSMPYDVAQAIGKRSYGPEIIAVPRGGFTPAAMIAYALDSNSLGSTQYIFDKVVSDKLNAWSGVHIIVDDIADTGAEIEKLKTYYTETFDNHRFIFATLIKRKSCPSWKSPDLWAFEYPGPEWIIFPWAPNDIPTSPLSRTRGGEVQDRSSEIPHEISMESDPPRGANPGTPEISSGGDQVRSGQLEEGNAVGCHFESHGEPLPMFEDSASGEGSTPEGSVVV